MKLNTVIAVFAGICAALCTANPSTHHGHPDHKDYNQLQALIHQASHTAKQNLHAGRNHTSEACTLENLSVRREWYDIRSCSSRLMLRFVSRSTLSKEDRKSYTDAVLCLGSKPARTPASVAPGAKSRWDVCPSIACRVARC
jgi:hypothetical protein